MQINQYWIKLLLFFCVFMSSVNAASLSYSRLLLVSSGGDKPYTRVEQSFSANINENLTDLLSIKSIQVANTAFLDTAISNKKNNTFDWIITMGAKAAYEVLRRHPSTEVLSIFIPRQTYLKIRHEVTITNPLSNWSAIYLDQPIERLINLAKLIATPNETVSLFDSVLINNTADSRRCAGEHIKTLMKNVNIYEKNLTSSYLKYVLESSDILVATANMVKQSPNAVKWMLYMAYQRNVPVIGYSQAFVDAGAIAAVYSTPEDVGKQAAKWFDEMQSDGKPRMSRFMYPAYFQVSVNQIVSKAFGKGSLNESWLHKMLVESTMNCREFNYRDANKVKQQITRR